MADRIEVVQGIIHVLSTYVRERTQDVAELRTRLAAIEGATGSDTNPPLETAAGFA
jgi:hypothetical protein